jgi:hypothetical protein
MFEHQADNRVVQHHQGMRGLPVSQMRIILAHRHIPSSMQARLNGSFPAYLGQQFPQISDVWRVGS